MSHKSLSIGMLPIVRLKKASSIVLAFTVLRAGIKRRIFPNLTLLLGYCVRVYSLSMSWAWSCKASTWLESLRPLTSAKRKTSYTNSYFKKFTCNLLKILLNFVYILSNVSLTTFWCCQLFLHWVKGHVQHIWFGQKKRWLFYYVSKHWKKSCWEAHHLAFDYSIPQFMLYVLSNRNSMIKCHFLKIHNGMCTFFPCQSFWQFILVTFECKIVFHWL